MQHRAKKRFGQNFLKDFSYVNKIVQSIPNIFRGEKVIEVGVGLGDLTDKLLECYQLKAYEVDVDLCSFLTQKYKAVIDSGDLILVYQDVLKLVFKEGWLDDEEYILVSNLPYYIASAILLRVLKDPKCKGFVVMTQKEVAQKFCALSGDRNFCALSVITQTLGEPEMLFDVPKEAFEPMPKVISSVFRIRKNSNSIQQDFEEMLRVAFCSPRKKLLSNFASRYDKKIVESLFEELSIDLDIRAHQISATIYHQIYNKLKVEKYGK
ncbi:16S rRNA (adenine(1518)-N(6)/adenine(1519)-N(6))-dimethyltransferase [Helicobacter sp. 13S00482-2]|nr:16S rRNA (adenine(1518)-N(6)/adenine(1519)-N(6))-dimethyltransferase [Helicobacter sp. 13S00482-2]